MRATFNKFCGFQRLLAVVFSVLMLVGCESIRPNLSKQEPEAPLPSIENSILAIPLRLNVSSLEAEVNNQLSVAHGPSGMYWVSGQSVGGNATIQYGVHRSGSASISAEGDGLLIKVPVAINNGRVDWHQKIGFVNVKKHFDFGGGAVVTIKARFSVDPDWKLRVIMEPAFQWTERAWIDINPPVGHIKIDVASRVEPKILEKLPGIAEKASKLAESLPTRAFVEEAWKALSKPINLSDNPQLTLDIAPISMGVGAIKSAGGDLIARPAMVAKLRVYSGAGGSRPELTPLPKNTGDVGENGVRASVRVDATFASLNEVVEKYIVGKTYEFDGGEKLTINAAKISAFGKKVLVKLDFDAKLHSWLPFSTVSGWLYLVGSPKYDDSIRRLSVEDFNYDLDTQNLLVKSADWLLHGTFVNKIKSALVFDLSKNIDPIRHRVEAGAQGLKIVNGVNLNAITRKFEISDLHVGKDAIGIFAKATGEAEVLVSK